MGRAGDGDRTLGADRVRDVIDSPSAIIIEIKDVSDEPVLPEL
jgi:hypothetical protein